MKKLKPIEEAKSWLQAWSQDKADCEKYIRKCIENLFFCKDIMYSKYKEKLIDNEIKYYQKVLRELQKL
jgi:hypothetical protein